MIYNLVNRFEWSLTTNHNGSPGRRYETRAPANSSAAADREAPLTLC